MAGGPCQVVGSVCRAGGRSFREFASKPAHRVSIQSQREQAESQLRASMFNSLISPIAGPQSGDKPMPVDREIILIELLAFNFNENFEMKPLMEDAIKRLATEKPKCKDSEDPLQAIWYIARRI